MFEKYFKQGQKLRIKPLHVEQKQGRLEFLTGHIMTCGEGRIELRLPYGTTAGEEYPFEPQMPLEVVSDALGMGLRVIGRFAGFLRPDVIQVEFSTELKLFKPRFDPRIDIPVGLRFSRGRGNLRSLREKWQKNVGLLSTRNDITDKLSFPHCAVNISAGGIRFTFGEQAQVGDLCLLLVALRAGEPPICAVAEVVWLQRAGQESRTTAGMQFIHILKEDQRRIETFVWQQQREIARAEKEEKSKQTA